MAPVVAVGVEGDGLGAGGATDVVVGGVVVGGAFLLPTDSATRMVLFVAGGLPLALAMIAFPVWWVILASNVR